MKMGELSVCFVMHFFVTYDSDDIYVTPMRLLQQIEISNVCGQSF